MSLQDQQLAETASLGARNLAEAFANWSCLLDFPDPELHDADAMGLTDQVAEFSMLLLHWHEVAALLLPAQSARLSGMSPEYRIPASEVARRLGIATHQQV
ncbi:hypothetical protein [Vulcanococcus limneticus]|uniref:hypothetical protein n=1 Tax=Vulcanococcus limneticus TaxID=2170428 RepID=UPI00398C1931